MASGEKDAVLVHPARLDDEQRTGPVDDPPDVVVLPSEVGDAPGWAIGVAGGRVLRLVAQPRRERNRLSVRRPFERFDLLGQRRNDPRLAAYSADREDEELRSALLPMTGEGERATIR